MPPNDPMPQDCRTIEPWLSAFVDGQLEEARAAQVREHLADCPRCLEELKALETLGMHLATLKRVEVPDVPTSTLFTGLRALPDWLVGVAILRRWAVAGGGMALVCGLVVLLLRWPQPLPATVTANATQQTIQQLTAGTTLLAKAGDTVALQIPSVGGTLTLHGPGSLIVREAALGRLRQDPRLVVELPSGTLEIRMLATGAPPHDIRVSTPQASLRLTGTWVFVSADPLRTQVAVLEGEATLQSIASRQRLTLTPGQTAQVQAGWVTVGRIPTELWLQYKGLAGPRELASPNTPIAPNAPTLWHEQTQEIPHQESKQEEGNI